jgi:LacI family transcriptional regulator
VDRHELEIGIPKNISLMGFDNISFSVLPRINLTTVEQPFYTMASAAVDMLIRQIEEPAGGYSRIVLEPTLVKRGTCRIIT